MVNLKLSNGVVASIDYVDSWNGKKCKCSIRPTLLQLTVLATSRNMRKSLKISVKILIIIDVSTIF